MQALTSFIHRNTKGNPFFVNQVLKSLYGQGLIFFSNEEFKWKWHDSIFGSTDISKSVLELLRQRILSFDSDVQQSLKIASCLGSPFSLTTLKILVDDANVLESMLSTGMITQYDRSNLSYYRFAHDQIQEAAVSLLSEDRSELLYYIGKKLCLVFTREELDANIFTVVGILCYAKNMIKDQGERYKIAKLCMRAGKKAMAMTAFEQSFDYFQTGIKLLANDCWVTHYRLSKCY